MLGRIYSHADVTKSSSCFVLYMANFAPPPPPVCVSLFAMMAKNKVKLKCGWYRNVNWFHALYNQPLHALGDCIDDDW